MSYVPAGLCFKNYIYFSRFIPGWLFISLFSSQDTKLHQFQPKLKDLGLKGMHAQCAVHIHFCVYNTLDLLAALLQALS